MNTDWKECPDCGGVGHILDIDGNTSRCERCKGEGLIDPDEEEDADDED